MRLCSVTVKLLQIEVLITVAALAEAVYDEDLELQFRKMPFTDFINHFNRQNHSFKITHYKDMDLMLSAVPPRKSTLFTRLLGPEMLENLPRNFDAREKWPECDTVNLVYHQGMCGSCWAFGVSTTASDRTCIHTKKSVRLSEQDFKCCANCYNTSVCRGGDPDAAFIFWQLDGLVSIDCKAYNVTDLASGDVCPYQCDNEYMSYQKDKHYAASIYNIPDDVEQIKAELVHNGPIKASFPVYRDFKEYFSGIYERKFGELLGFHSVRVLGYGTEDGVDYWLVANSWGPVWGENGFFRIKHFQDERSIESHLQTGLPRKPCTAAKSHKYLT